MLHFVRAMQCNLLQTVALDNELRRGKEGIMEDMEENKIGTRNRGWEGIIKENERKHDSSDQDVKLEEQEKN